MRRSTRTGSVSTASVTERSLWSDALFSETTVEVHGYETDGHRRAGRRRWSCCRRRRSATSSTASIARRRRYQLIESVSGTQQQRGRPAPVQGRHRRPAQPLSRHEREPAGADSPDRRHAGAAARLRPPPTHAGDQQHRPGAVRAGSRAADRSLVYVEVGGAPRSRRRDRPLQPDAARRLRGAAERVGHVGAAQRLRRCSSSGRRRWPACSTQYEAPLDTRYAADGITPLGPPVLFSRVTAPDLRTSRSFTWDLAFDHRFNPQWALHFGVIDRRGSHELLVEPTDDRAGVRAAAGERRAIALSRGGSQRALHRRTGRRSQRVVRLLAGARRSQRVHQRFSTTCSCPVVGENGYGPARADVPHRLLARGRAMPLRNWLLVGRARLAERFAVLCRE